MKDMIEREKLIEEATKYLPDGRSFRRKRCKVCHAYWDLDQAQFHREDEKEFHLKGCPLK